MHPSQRVAFICQVDGCNARDSLPLYCMRCLDDAIHLHMPKRIIFELHRLMEQWKQLRFKIAYLKNKANKHYKKLSGLLEYLELRASIKPDDEKHSLNEDLE